MRHLLLMRHAKAEPAGPRSIDRERPLSARGRNDATLVAAAISARAMVPDLVLCSPARRTRQTMEALLAHLGAAPQTMLLDALYGATGTYAEAIREHGGAAECLMVIGHNPVIHATALELTGSGDRALRERLAAKFPTGALAVIAFEGNAWSATRSGGGELISLVRPRDLGGGAED